MERLNNLRNELTGFEGTCLEVDNKISSLGFYDEFEAYTEENLDSNCIVYHSTEEYDFSIAVIFEVTIKADSAEEDIKASYIKITEISNY